MAYNYNYAPAFPPWYFQEMPMMRQPRYRPRRRHREYDDEYNFDPVQALAHQRRQLEDLEKMFKKEEKKTPTAWESFKQFAAELGMMMLIGGQSNPSVTFDQIRDAAYSVTLHLVA